MKTFRKKIGTFEFEAHQLKALDQIKFLKILKKWKSIPNVDNFDHLVETFCEADFCFLVNGCGLRQMNFVPSEEVGEIEMDFDPSEAVMSLEELIETFGWLMEINTPDLKKKK